MKPPVSPAVPQSPTCASCPKAEWGSKVSRVSGKGVPACGKYQKLALYPLGDEILFLLRVPPNSLSNLRDYLAKYRVEHREELLAKKRVAYWLNKGAVHAERKEQYAKNASRWIASRRERRQSDQALMAKHNHQRAKRPCPR